jgi:hypothetical protein
VIAGLAFVCLLWCAPSALAAKGVYETFGTTGIRGGEFGNNFSNGISGVAVNSHGAGGAGAGDVYVLDRNLNRIQHFSADGAFISAFGRDVIESGPGNNGTEYEICVIAANCKTGIAGTLGGAMNTNSSAIGGVAIDQANGHLYLVDRSNLRIQEFDAAGNFIRAFGKNVASSGPEQADEQQRLTVAATSGQYKLSFGAQTTTDVEWNEAAAGLQVKLEALSSIGAGNVTVSGGPGSAGGGTPYLITFTGTLANVNQEELAVSAGTTPLGGGAGAAIATFNNGGDGFEVCETASNCQQGSSSGTGGSINSLQLGALAIAPPGAPNAGNVLVAEGGNSRVQEFSASGAFVRAFGWDAVASGPGNGAGQFEVCAASALDICKGATPGAGVGQFTRGLNSLSEDSSGNLYANESAEGFRVQRFALTGSTVVPQGAFACLALCGTAVGSNPVAVAVDTTTAPGTPGRVFVLKNFPKGYVEGPGIAALDESEARILEVDPVTAAVTATMMSRGEVGPNTGAGALALNTTSGRLYVTQRPSPVFIVDEVPPLALVLGEAEVGATTATLKATITPAPLPKLTTLYQFEYALKGSGQWKKAPENKVDVGKGPAPVAVDQKLEGLEINACYELKLIAHSKYHGAEGEEQGEFCTKPIAPVVATGKARWSSPPASGPSLTLTGTVNPGKDQTTYLFEYVSEEAFQASGFGGAAVAPALPAPAGHGLFTVSVLQTATGLDPAKAYRYRLVATNSVGTSTGQTLTVSPADPAARYYELVSEADSGGLGVEEILAVSDDGRRVGLGSQSLGDSHSLPGQTTPFLAFHGLGGWEVQQVNPDPEEGRAGGSFVPTAWFPSDLGTALWSHYSAAMQIRGEVEWTFTDPDGSRRAALPRLVPVSGRGTAETFFRVTGAAADLSSFVFQREEAGDASQRASATYLPGQPPTSGEPGDIYRVSGAGSPSPALTLVNRDPGGVLISNACGAWVGSNRFNSAGDSNLSNKGLNLRPVSADGAIIYFSVRPSGSSACNVATDRIRIFKRIGDASTVEVSACARAVPASCTTPDGDDFFQGASLDGGRAFFTTTRKLTESDEDTTLDLYLYDSNPPGGQPQLVQASAGEAVAVDHPVIGSGAEALEGVVDVSADGSRAYFVAKGRLTAAGTKGANNLYVYQRDDAHPTGRIAFVAKLDSGDSNLWAAAAKPAQALPLVAPGGKGGDGHLLLFPSQAKLLGADTDSAADLYRYDDETTQLACLTCAGNGLLGVSIALHKGFTNPDSAQESRIATEDASRVVFASAEQLSPDDHNTLPDAYEWHEGALNLITTGDASSSGLGRNVTGELILPLISRDGGAVLFATADRLVGRDQNSATDAYAARTGGGFPEAGAEISCTSAEFCRTAPVTPPAPLAVGSEATRAGNPPSPKPACPPGKVRKKGKCVKKGKKKAHKKSAKHRAGREPGGRR